MKRTKRSDFPFPEQTLRRVETPIKSDVDFPSFMDHAFTKSIDPAMHEEHPAISAPPPKRHPKRQLSLKTAIAAATQREGAEVRDLLEDFVDDGGIKGSGTLVRPQSSRQQDMEAYLLELQAEIVVREDQVAQREKRLEARELELNEREALLEAHRKILSSKHLPTDQEMNDLATERNKENRALHALQNELIKQETVLAENRKALREREDFIQKCENELVEKSMILTEREARVEQDEENRRYENKDD
jgi:chromosome segregation ATPase